MKRRDFIRLLAGTLAARPSAALAQPSLPVVGFLGSENPDMFATRLRAFHQGLREAGFVEGQNLAIEYRWADGKAARLPELAADLVARRVAVIAAAGSSAPALAAKAATATIPIVFQTGADPVKDGLVPSMRAPGGNITGATRLADTIEPRRLALLHEAVPNAAMIGFLVNAGNRIAASRVRAMEADARAMGLRLATARAGSVGEIEAGFADLARQGAGALSVGAGGIFHDAREAIVALAARYALPAMYEEREFVAAGGLMSYSAGPDDSYRQLGRHVGRVLMGEKPADLAIAEPGKFELVLNRTTAKGLGLDLPASVLARADEVIE